MKSTNWLANLFDHIEEYLLILLFPLLVIVVFIATGMRYLTVHSLPWSEELARYTMVWMAYLGASLGIKRNAHLGVAVLVNALPDKFKPYAAFVRLSIIILFNVLSIFYTVQIIQHQINMEQVSPAMRVPITWAYAAIPVGSLLMMIRCLQAMRSVGKANT